MLTDCPIPGAWGIGKVEGTGSNRVLILGEALGEEEAKDGGYPFRPWAPAGSILERAIKRLGYSRDSFLLWNAIPTHPPGNNLKGPWLAAALAWGRSHLENVIRLYQPCAILALGQIATSMATGLSGDGYNIGLMEGYTWSCAWSSLGVRGVVPSFHPAYLRRGYMSHFGCLLQDIEKAIAVAKDGRPLTSFAPIVPSGGYTLRPVEDEANLFLINAKGAEFIAYDIETPYSKSETEEAAEEVDEEKPADDKILSIQFSYGPGTGIFFPWREPYIEIAKRILALGVPKLGWNTWRFDDPRLVANGVHINGSNHDLMWAWHHLQPDLPRGLQFAAKFLGWHYPWKHLASSRPEFYGITDVDCLTTIRPALFRALKEAGIWNGYQRHILQLEPILSRMSQRGMPVDPKRYDEVKFELSCRVDGGLEEIQKLVPLDCKKIQIYKKEPKKKGPGVSLIGSTWTKIHPWKPSNQALTAYCKFKAFDLPRDFRSKKVTFDQLHMDRLYAKTKDPLFKAVRDYKDAAVVLTNHISNWRPDASGRVHSTFYYDPATGQLSSKRPNIQNAPKHKEGQGELFRSIIKASPEKTLVEFDFHGFHALMMGFEARDLDFIRLVRIDIHSFVTAHFMKVPGYEKAWELSDEALAEYLARVKKEHKWTRDAKIKHAVLGYNNGMGWKKLYNQYKEYFKSEGEAKQVNSMLDDLFPVTCQFRKDVRIKAHEQQCLVSRHGYIRRFWEVMKWKYGVGLVPGGEQAEQAVAFLSSNDAFGEIKDRILELEALDLLEKYGFINTIHDSLLFECPDTLLEECIATVKPIMEAPSKVLVDPVIAPGGLVCNVGVSVGKSWDAMRELK